MLSTLCSIWDDFSNWVTNSWTQLTYIFVITGLGILGVMAFLSFFKSSGKDKKPLKWGSLVLSILMFGIMLVLVLARYA